MVKNRFYDQWVDITGQHFFKDYKAPVYVTTRFQECAGLEAALWFSSEYFDSDISELQRYHCDQRDPESEPPRLGFHPDHNERHFYHRHASDGFLAMQMALCMAKSTKQIWGLLTYGTLFRYCLSQKSKGHYVCDKLLSSAIEEAGDLLPSLDAKSWHVLPDVELQQDFVDLPDDEANRVIANHHKQLFEQYSFRLIHLVVEETDSYRSVLLEKVNTKKRLKIQNELYERQREIARLQEAEFLKHHPLHQLWGNIEREELERYVWSMPLLQLSEKFGVSDSMIIKRCKKLGIRRPGRGFWAKVDARKIPHPNGQPIG